jgi:hypothetical protein
MPSDGGIISSRMNKYIVSRAEAKELENFEACC